MIHENVLEFLSGSAGDGRDSAVINGEDGDGETLVDGSDEFTLGEEIIESGEIGKVGEDFGDVESGDGGGEA